MMKKIILLLGGNKLNYGIMKKFQLQGFLVYVIDWHEQPQLKGDRHFAVDIKEPDKIMYILKKEHLWDRVIFAYSSIDLAVQSVAILNRAIGLHTISDKAVKYASSKSLMTEKWEKECLLHRKTYKLKRCDETIENYVKERKMIMKPDNAASSRGITILEPDSDYSTVRLAYDKAVKEAANDTAVLEEYVEGTEYTVEMIGDREGNVAVYAISKKAHTQNTDKNRIAVKLHYNSIPEDKQVKIAQFGIKCYKSLGFSSSFGHLEIIEKENGELSPLEMGARSSGFIASDLADITSGADYLGDLISVQKGRKLAAGLHSQTKKSSMYFFYDFPAGFVIKRPCSLLDFCDKRIHSRYYDRTCITAESKFGLIDNDNARYGFEILEGPKELMTEEYIREKEMLMMAYLAGKGVE